jgi:hypothetical protein
VKSRSQINTRKRTVILTLNEDLVKQANSTTDNLSALGERLLSGYVSDKWRERLAHKERVAETVAIWNKFSTGNDYFADEYSTL